MNFKFDNERPIYIQLVEQLEIYIISGKLKPGEKLPSVRDLAISSKVNPNTMQKALVELEELKLIYTERTNGKYVTNDQKLINKYKEKYAKDKVLNYLFEMASLGFNQEEAINYLKQLGGIKEWNY